jgi:hypothetical protein
VPEYGIPVSLETPRGTLTFNDYSAGAHFRLSRFEISRPIRSSTEDAPQRSGYILPERFPRRGAHPILAGDIAAFNDQAVRAAMLDTIKGLPDSLRDAAGTLKWTPSGQLPRQMTVRLLEDVQDGGDLTKTFQLALVSDDPAEYSQALHQLDTTTLQAGGTGNAWTFGTVATPRWGFSQPWNLASKNPGFELDTTGWSGINGGTIARVTAGALFGAASGQITPTASASTGAYYDDAGVRLPALAGETWTASISAKGTNTQSIVIVVREYDSGGSFLRQTQSGSQTFNGATQRFSYTAALGASTASIDVAILSAVASVSPFLVDNLLVERSGSASAYSFGAGWSFGTAPAGGAGVTTNAGNTDSWPVVRIFGPVSAPILTNVTTGKRVSFPALTLADGQFVELDMRRGSVIYNGLASQSMLRFLDVVASDFWPLIPGGNNVRLSGSGYSATTKATVYWRDAWNG